MDYNLKGKVAMVTGGSKGIGLAIAEGLAAQGCALRLVARDLASLQQARDRIRERHPVEIQIESVNLSEPGGAEDLGAAFPETEILINSAGAIGRGDLLTFM